MKLDSFPILFLISLFTAGIQDFPLFASDKGKIKYQVEVSLDLTEKAAKKILSHYQFESKERTDYVFDIYDGKNFLLFPSPQKIRFRLKEEDDKKVIQINKNTKTFSRTCENFLPILIRERKSGELNASNKQYKSLLRGNTLLEQFDTNPHNTCKPLKIFSNTLQKLNIPLQSEIEKSFGFKNWMYLPINISKKIKWKKKTNLEFGQMTISLSQGKDFIGEKFLQEKWEIEFQINPMEWKESICPQKYCKLEESICEFLKKEEIAKEDLDPIKISPYTKIKERLTPCNKEFGFSN